MLETEPTLFKVVDSHNNHLWLEALEGEDKGIRVSVPVLSRDYSDEIQKKVHNLSVGEVWEMVLISEEENSPNWRINEIDEAVSAPVA